MKNELDAIFEIDRFAVALKNLTSQMEIIDPQVIILSTLDLQGFDFILPTKNLQVEHSVMIGLYTKPWTMNPKNFNEPAFIKKAYIVLTAKVTSISPLNEKFDEVRVTLQQYEKDVWTKLVGSIEKRQNSISSLLTKMSGGQSW